jgi:two-component system phosphate regulon sensor histidine kinase PhoR
MYGYLSEICCVKFRNIQIVVALVSVAIIALIGVQLYWAHNAYLENEKQFNEKVSVALQEATGDMNDNLTCFEMFSRLYINPNEGFYMMKQPWESYSKFVSPEVNAPDTVTIYNPAKGPDLRYNYNSLKFSDPVSVDILFKFRMRFDDTLEFKKERDQYQSLDARNFKDVISGNQPIYKTYDTTYMKTSLDKYFKLQGVNGNFHFGVIRNDNDSLAYFSAGSKPSKLLHSEVSYPLTSDKYFSKPYRLAVYFDHSSETVLASLWVVLLSSIAIIGVLVLAFIYFISTILRQKKLSQMKNDFIDNMTHEFNTPISNIALSIETLFENEIPGQDKIRNILQIIGSENERLRENVERVLQIAAVEKENFNLKPESIHLDTLIRKVLAIFEIRIANGQGRIEYVNNCTEEQLYADETHIINMIYNLIDNALKYGGSNPVVVIDTRNTASEFVISVTDNGIGMTKEETRRIFEKFYRAQAGNIQDVKGFGLGLSYVKNIVMAHHGHIEVASEWGKGTCFEVYLPFNYLVKK